MKYYDKNLSKINTNIKNVLLVLVVFVIGFIVGYVVGGGSLFNAHTQDPQSNTVIENRTK